MNRQNKINFTVKAINAFPLPEIGKRAYYYDLKVRGLGMSITNKGSKTFILYRKIDGRPERVTLGRFPDLTIENARDKATEANAQIADGKNPNDEKRKMRAEVTLRELFDEYLERHAKPHKKSWLGDQQLYNSYLSDWANHKISHIYKYETDKKHADIGKQHGLYAANRMISLLRAMFNKAIGWGWEGVNPAIGIKKFKEKTRDRFLQPHELPYFFESLAREENTTAKDYVLLSLLTGARKATVLAMRWDEISFEREEWRIPETKNGDPLTLPLSGQAIETLTARRKATAGEWVFPSESSKAGHLQDPKKAWKRLLMRAEIAQLVDLLAGAHGWDDGKVTAEKNASEMQLGKALARFQEEAKQLKLDVGMFAMQDLRIHDLRRSLGSWQAVTGANSFIIGKSLGHKSQQATAIYARLNLDPVRASVEKATAAMMKAGGR